MSTIATRESARAKIMAQLIANHLCGDITPLMQAYLDSDDPSAEHAREICLGDDLRDPPGLVTVHFHEDDAFSPPKGWYWVRPEETHIEADWHPLDTRAEAVLDAYLAEDKTPPLMAPTAFWSVSDCLAELMEACGVPVVRFAERDNNVWARTDTSPLHEDRDLNRVLQTLGLNDLSRIAVAPGGPAFGQWTRLADEPPQRRIRVLVADDVHVVGDLYLDHPAGGADAPVWRHADGTPVENPEALVKWMLMLDTDVACPSERVAPWNPMGSCPRDGRPVLLLFSAGHVEDARVREVKGELTYTLFDGAQINDTAVAWAIYQVPAFVGLTPLRPRAA